MPSAETARGAQPSQIILQMLNGAWVAQAIGVAAALGVADALASGSKNIDQLASATSSNADSLYRLMRALASVGVFAEPANREFALTPLSDCLRTDAPNSMRNAASMRILPILYRSWGELLDSVKTGETGLKRAFGLPNPFGYFAEHPEESKIFDDAMTELSRNVGTAVAGAYDFGKFSKIVDAGGGYGILLIAILKRHAGPRGVLFDLPHVMEGAQAAIGAAGLAGRCETVAGDLFESIPAGADCYLMKSIVHAFNNERASVILKNIRRVIAPNGRLILIEHAVPDGNEPALSKLADLQMLVMTSGRERTRREFAELLESGGFKLAAIHSTAAPQSIIEGIPA